MAIETLGSDTVVKAAKLGGGPMHRVPPNSQIGGGPGPPCPPLPPPMLDRQTSRPTYGASTNTFNNNNNLVLMFVGGAYKARAWNWAGNGIDYMCWRTI
jgi:hypothetical protein